MQGITVPFNGENSVWGCSVYVPYIPHKDPKNPAYIPIPDPVNDPDWIPIEELQPLKVASPAKASYDHEPRAILTEATLPSAGSEPDDIHVCGVTTLASHTNFHSLVTRDASIAVGTLECEASPLAEAVCPPPTIDTFADAGSNTAVRSPSPIPSIRTPDRGSVSHSSLPSGSIITVIEDWHPAQQSFIATELVPVRPATAFENRKLENVMFDCDGHMSCTNNLTGVSKSTTSPPKITIPPAHVDDFETANQMPVGRGTRDNIRTVTNDRASQTQECLCGQSLTNEHLLLNFLGQSSSTDGGAVQEQAIFANTVNSVTRVYERWGLTPEDAYVDVITGFHRVGSPSKRLCLGINKRQSPFLISLATWTPYHTKLSIYVDYYCAFCETLRDDQVMKILKDTLWAVYNGGRVLDVIVIDSMDRELPAGKYQVATVEPLSMLESLVSAWGGEYKYSKFPISA